jgi:hypothetical protein
LAEKISLKFLKNLPSTEDQPLQEKKMDVNGIARAASTIAETGIKQEAGMAILKRAQEIEKATATQLLDAIPAAGSIQNLPEHLGQNINTTA